MRTPAAKKHNLLWMKVPSTLAYGEGSLVLNVALGIRRLLPSERFEPEPAILGRPFQSVSVRRCHFELPATQRTKILFSRVGESGVRCSRSSLRQKPRPPHEPLPTRSLGALVGSQEICKSPCNWRPMLISCSCSCSCVCCSSGLAAIPDDKELKAKRDTRSSKATGEKSSIGIASQAAAASKDPKPTKKMRDELSLDMSALVESVASDEGTPQADEGLAKEKSGYGERRKTLARSPRVKNILDDDRMAAREDANPTPRGKTYGFVRWVHANFSG